MGPTQQMGFSSARKETKIAVVSRFLVAKFCPVEKGRRLRCCDTGVDWLTPYMIPVPTVLMVGGPGISSSDMAQLAPCPGNWPSGNKDQISSPSSFVLLLADANNTEGEEKK